MFVDPDHSEVKVVDYVHRDVVHPVVETEIAPLNSVHGTTSAEVERRDREHMHSMRSKTWNRLRRCVLSSPSGAFNACPKISLVSLGEQPETSQLQIEFVRYRPAFKSPDRDYRTKHTLNMFHETLG